MDDPSKKLEQLEKKKERIEESIVNIIPQEVTKNVDKIIKKQIKILGTGENNMPSSKKVVRKFLSSINFTNPSNPREKTELPIDSPRLKRLNRQREMLEIQIKKEKSQQEGQQKTAEEIAYMDMPDDFRATLRKLGLGRGNISKINKSVEGDMEVYRFLLRRDVVFTQDEMNRVRTDKMFREVLWDTKGPVLVLQRESKAEGTMEVRPAIPTPVR